MNATTMRLPVIVKSHLFFSMALAAVLVLVAELIHRWLGAPHTNVVPVGVSASVLGLIVWIVGRFKSSRDRDAAPAEEADETEDRNEGPLNFLRQPKYWGGILCLSGLLFVVFVIACKKPLPPAKPVVPPPPVVRPAPPPQPKPVVAFPKLTLSGLTLSGGNSSAVINGRVLCVGERVEGAQVTEIDENGVQMELDGETNHLVLY